MKDKGVVYKKLMGRYEVHVNGRILPCGLSSRLRKELSYDAGESRTAGRKVRRVKVNDDVDPVAVGDVVRFVDARDGTGMIVEVLPRLNQLTRRTPVPMPSARPFEQVIVSNLDQVVPVFAAASPEPKWNMLDRYLVSAEMLDLPSLICITKIDLAQDEPGRIEAGLLAEVDELRRIGYRVILCSVISGEGLAELKQALRGQVSVFVGKSGVGKSSLLNAIQPGLGLRVNEVSQVTGKGKHTTTHMEMVPLESGGAIVDTPGMREFGLWDFDASELADFFPEMRPFLGECRFGLSCRHDEEPGCAVRRAVNDGKISPRRYHSYQRLMLEA